MITKPYEEIAAEDLIAAREAEGLSIGALSKLINISKPTISNIEHGKTGITRRTYNAYVSYFNMDVDAEGELPSTLEIPVASSEKIASASAMISQVVSADEKTTLPREQLNEFAEFSRSCDTLLGRIAELNDLIESAA